MAAEWRHLSDERREPERFPESAFFIPRRSPISPIKPARIGKIRPKTLRKRQTSRREFPSGLEPLNRHAGRGVRDLLKSIYLLYLRGREAQVVQEFVEVETGKGRDALDRRPQLRAALSVCKKQGAALLIAKLDRLARNVHFVSGLLETGVEFLAADMPHASKVMIQIYAVMAEHERDQVSARTKAALAAAKARGIVLGRTGPANLKANIKERQKAAQAFADRLKPVLAGLRAENLSGVKQVARLNDLGIAAPRGGKWTRTQLRRTVLRLGT